MTIDVRNTTINGVISIHIPLARYDWRIHAFPLFSDVISIHIPLARYDYTYYTMIDSNGQFQSTYRSRGMTVDAP